MDTGPPKHHRCTQPPTLGLWSPLMPGSQSGRPEAEGSTRDPEEKGHPSPPQSRRHRKSESLLGNPWRALSKSTRHLHGPLPVRRPLTRTDPTPCGNAVEETPVSPCKDTSQKPEDPPVTLPGTPTHLGPATPLRHVEDTTTPSPRKDRRRRRKLHKECQWSK